VKVSVNATDQPQYQATDTFNAKAESQPGLTILTSGTTGTPKAARHSLESLAKPTRVHPSFLQTSWMLCYRPNLYAGLQVILQCLVNGGQLVVTAPDSSAQLIAQHAVNAGVQYASATPSYWRWLLTFAPRAILSQIPFKQITLGGEIVDQHILDRLASLYPDARLVHIYATTELGRCFSVTDKQAGFASKFLDQPSPDGVSMKIENGELMVKSANAMLNYDPLCGQQCDQSEWYATGDLVKQENGRCYFLGRRNDMINVGGNKVSPVKVEDVIMKLPGIEDVRVFARKSSIMGQLVSCEIVPNADVDQKALRQQFKAHCAEYLNDYETPQLLKFVEQIQTSSAMKKVRSS
ncbi:MAG TPA: long-chain fatty acid--CoA ligase, partial [Phycisphaerales bacterium]|nr:long-chain fatty acid--CoA ligase [Phycisphaerales bacterium]